MVTRKGITPLHTGLILEKNIIAPPTQFAFATFGVMKERELKVMLQEITVEIERGNINTEETPLLEYYSKNNLLNTNELKQIIQKKHGSQKMILKSSAMTKTKEGNKLATYSKNEQAIITIDSRRLRKEQKPYNISIYRPFNIHQLYFAGGTQFINYNLEKGHHWSKGQEIERLYLESLEEKQREQFERKIDLIDYPRACAIITFYNLITNNELQELSGSGDIPKKEPVLIYDFQPKKTKNAEEKYEGTKQGLEILLLRYSPKKLLKEILNQEPLNLGELDQLLLGRKGFVTREVNQEYSKGRITKGAILNTRSFPEYTWAIIQALEEHYFKKEREFKGYSLEFQNQKPYTTTSIVFDETTDYKAKTITNQTAERKAIKDLSMRILFDENFGMPYLLYKNFNPTKEDLKRIHIIKDKPTAEPTGLINLPEDKAKYTKAWIDTDWRTGRKCLCIIREPTDQILYRAEEISKRATMGIKATTIRNQYYKLMQERKK